MFSIMSVHLHLHLHQNRFAEHDHVGADMCATVHKISF